MGFRFWERSRLVRVWRVTDQGHHPVSHSDLCTLIPACTFVHTSHIHTYTTTPHTKSKMLAAVAISEAISTQLQGIGDFCSLCFQGWCVLTGRSNGTSLWHPPLCKSSSENVGVSLLRSVCRVITEASLCGLGPGTQDE